MRLSKSSKAKKVLKKGGALKLIESYLGTCPDDNEPLKMAGVKINGQLTLGAICPKCKKVY